MTPRIPSRDFESAYNVAADQDSCYLFQTAHRLNSRLSFYNKSSNSQMCAAELLRIRTITVCVEIVEFLV